LVKTNLFLVSGIVKETNGYFLLKKLGGVYQRFPYVTLLFVISAFSLAGIPPLSGFWGKFILAKAGLEVEQYTIVVVSLLVGFLTLYSMSKIWASVFWSPAPEALENEIKYDSANLWKKKPMMLIASVFLALITLGLSIYPAWLINFSIVASEQLLNSKIYIDAVLHH
jgi:multicomponent Na+:H+ antiporter subunit D